MSLKDIFLMNTADHLHTLVCEKFNLRPENLLLRFKGMNSYLYGDSQLIYFEEIRDYLKQNNSGPLTLELVEKIN